MDDQLLRHSDPHRGLDLTQVRGEIDDMAREAAALPRRRRLGAWARAGLTVVAVGLAAPPLAWAAGGFLAQTGEFGAPGMSEEDTSEWINACAPDVAEFMVSLPRPSADPPAGHTWEGIARDRAALLRQWALRDEEHPMGAPEDESLSCARGVGPLYQATGLRIEILLHAEGIHACRALAAHRAGDRDALLSEGRAAAELMDEQFALGGFGDDVWKMIRDAAASGDVDTWGLTADDGVSCG